MRPEIEEPPKLYNLIILYKKQTFRFQRSKAASDPRETLNAQADVITYYLLRSLARYL
jgi:hypothetical protein